MQKATPASVRIRDCTGAISLLVLCFLSIARPAPAFAVPPAFYHFPQSMLSSVADRWRDAFILALVELEAAGVTELGSESNPARLSVEELRRRAASVQYIQVSMFKKGPGARRWSAFNEPKRRRVYINSWAKLNAEQLSILSVHETLGALGFEDSEYQLSLLIHLLPRIRRADGADGHRTTNLASHLNDRLYYSVTPANFPRDPDAILILSRAGGDASGGGDAVGGGGDADALSFKYRLLVRLLERMKPESSWVPFAKALDLKLILLFSPVVGPAPSFHIDLNQVRLDPASLLLYLPRGLAIPESTEARHNSDLVVTYLLQWLEK